MADATPRPRPVASVPARARRPRTRPPRPLLPHARAHAENVWSSAPPYGLTRCTAIRWSSPAPEAPSSVRRSLEGSRFAYKGVAALASAHQTPSHQPEPPPAPVEAATASLGSGRPKSPASAPTVSPCPYYSSPARFLSPRAAPHRELATAAATRRLPVCPPPGNPSPTAEPPNQTLATPTPSHARPRPSPPPALAGIWPKPRRPAPRTTLQRFQFS
jgi:hypothetical protein